MILAKDRRGRAPFSAVAVLILLGCTVSGAYLQSLDRHAPPRPAGRDGGDDGGLALSLRQEVERLAVRAMEEAEASQLGYVRGDRAPALWRLNDRFRELFEAAVVERFDGRALGPQGPAAKASSADAVLSPVSLVHRTVNRFGMAVNASSPAGLRALGTVNFTLSSRGAPDRNVTIEMDVERPSSFIFALSQGARMRRDCTSEGLVELFMTEMLAGFLGKVLDDLELKAIRNFDGLNCRISRYWNECDFTSSVLAALEWSLVLEEEILFGNSSRGDLQYELHRHISEDPRRPFRVAGALPHPEKYLGPNPGWSEPPSEGELAVDLGPLHGGIGLFDAKDLARERARFALVPSSYLPWPNITLGQPVFAGEEEGEDIYMLEVHVDGLYQLDLHPDSVNFTNAVRQDIPLHFDLSLDARKKAKFPLAPESGGLHCQVEDRALFDSELARPREVLSALEVRVQNSSGVDVLSLPGPILVDLIIDSEPAGAFRREDIGPGGIVVPRLPPGPHSVSAVLTMAGGGEVEHASATVLASGDLQVVALRGDGAPDTSRFWSAVLSHIRGVPPASRTARMMELFSTFAGYPVPPGLDGLRGGERESAEAILDWCRGLDEHLSLQASAPGALAALDAGTWDAMQAAVEITLQTVRCVESVLSSIEVTAGAARSISLELLNVTFSWTRDDARGATRLELSCEGDLGRTFLEFRREDASGGWRVRKESAGGGTGGGPDGGGGLDAPSSSRDWASLAIRGAVDLAFIVNSAVGFYKEWVKYTASDGGASIEERLDLTLDIVGMSLDTITMVTDTLAPVLFSKAGPGLVKRLDVAGEVAGFFTGVVNILQTVLGAVDRFRGDPALWEALFTGFDEETLLFHLAISMTVLSAVQVAVAAGAGAKLALVASLSPYLGPISAVLALASFLVLLYFDHDEIGHLIHGSVTEEGLGAVVSSVEGTLAGTLGTVSALNGLGTGELLLLAREGRGAALLLDRAGLLVPDVRFAGERAALSRAEYARSWANEHQSRAARGLKCLLTALWMQADDLADPDTADAQRATERPDIGCFDGGGNAGEDYDFDGDIYITDPSRGGRQGLAQGDIAWYLGLLDPARAKNVSVEYVLRGNGVTSSGLQHWVDTLCRISDRVRLCQDRLSASQAMLSYVLAQEGRKFSPDWGYIEVRADPAFEKLGVRMRCHEGPRTFNYLSGNASGQDDGLELVLAQGGGPLHLFVEPLEYDVEATSRTPDLELGTDRRTVAAATFYSFGFGSGTAAFSPSRHSIYFTVSHPGDRLLHLRVACQDAEGRVRGGLMDRDVRGDELEGVRFYITSDWVPGFDFGASTCGEKEAARRSLTFRININASFDTDGDGSFDASEEAFVRLSSVRDDHVKAMLANDGAGDDLLGYSLSLTEEPRERSWKLALRDEVKVVAGRIFWDKTSG